MNKPPETELNQNQAIESRHGLEDDISPEEKLELMDSLSVFHFTSSRHSRIYSQHFKIKHGSDPRKFIVDWRPKEKQKTVSVALLLCLNIGVDPPDIVKTSPCAKLECWIDPFSLPAAKALEAIGKNLQQQYEVWQPRARYKLFLDPSVEETKKLCCSLRRSSKEERILFHYNGHGVPKPTSSGEIWVFNKTYTQYIPVSISDLQLWLGSPCMYVYDCSAAGNIIKSFNRFAAQKEHESQRPNGASRDGKPFHHQDSIQLAACGVDEILPLNPDLPADLFSSCLTTPIEMAMRWFVLRNPLLTKLKPDMVLKLPGRLNDRRTPLGDLSWIFTSITDTIAWTLLPPPLFQKLFRQDLMVAALFRNFLLADRIMRSLKCHPVSVPALPETHNHHLWKSWDMTVDFCLSQLPSLIAAGEGGPPAEYQNSPFFAEQLTAFEIWLSQASVKKSVPEQLPIVLQVLLSQVHRARALKLLSQFFDLGLWAVNAALLVGIFPYVLKLLQSPAVDMKPVLIVIWARLLPVDNSCQADLLKDNGFHYFLNLLKIDESSTFSDLPRIRSFCTLILAFLCRDFIQGKESCLKHNLLSLALPHLSDHLPSLRQWTCLMLGQLLKSYNDAKMLALEMNLHDKLAILLNDPEPEIRAAALFTLTVLFDDDLEKTPNITSIELNLALTFKNHAFDASPIVRKEWVVYMSQFIYRYQEKFLKVAQDLIEEEKELISTSVSLAKPKSWLSYENGDQYSTSKNVSPSETDSDSGANQRVDGEPVQYIYVMIWKLLLILTCDPFPQIADSAQHVVDQIHYKLIHTKLSESFATTLMNMTPPGSPTFSSQNTHFNTIHSSQAGLFSKKSQLTNTLRRSASYTLKNLYPFSSGGDIEEIKPISKGSSTSLNQAQPEVITPSSTTPIDPTQPISSQSLVLESFYFDWCAERFQEPQMKPPEADEPGSVTYLQRQWRKQRNDRILQDMDHQAPKTHKVKWTTELKTIYNENQPNSFIFHRYEPHLINSDDKNWISVWDWENNSRLNRIKIGPSPIGVSSLKLINEEDEAILAVALNDGAIKLYRKYWDRADLASSFRGLFELPISRKPVKGSSLPLGQAGVSMEWQQTRGALIIGGEAPTVKIWDAASEICSVELPTRSTVALTSLTSDRLSGNFIVAGFLDGSLRAYDRRLPSRDSMVRVWREHHSGVVGCHLQAGSTRELVSASSSGQIKLWDLRNQASIKGFANKTGITALAVHEQAPLVAIGTSQNGTSVYTMQGQHLGTTHHYQGSAGLLLSQRVASVNSIAFHPSRMILGSATGGGLIGSLGPTMDRSTNLTLTCWDAPITPLSTDPLYAAPPNNSSLVEAAY